MFNYFISYGKNKKVSEDAQERRFAGGLGKLQP